jgi:hypothetical protein
MDTNQILNIMTPIISDFMLMGSLLGGLYLLLNHKGGNIRFDLHYKLDDGLGIKFRKKESSIPVKTKRPPIKRSAPKRRNRSPLKKQYPQSTSTTQ